MGADICRSGQADRPTAASEENRTNDYSPHIMSWSPQGMRVLRQCKFPRAKVMFVTIQSENIRPSKKGMNKAVTMLIFKFPYNGCASSESLSMKEDESLEISSPLLSSWTSMINSSLTLQNPNCPMFAVSQWITTSPHRWPTESLPSTCVLCTPPALH
jgi:hypothetical protein